MNRQKSVKCLVFMVVFALLFKETFEKSSNKVYVPQKLNDCSAKLDNGVVIDLKPLDDYKSPR